MWITFSFLFSERRTQGFQNNFNSGPQGQARVTYGPNVFGGPSVNYGPPVTGRGGYRS
jgi:hypothetical protein